MRIVGWMIKLLFIIIMVCFFSVFTTVYMLDQYINRLMNQWNLATDSNSISLDVGDYVAKLTDPGQLWTGNPWEPKADTTDLHEDEKSMRVSEELDVPVFQQQMEPEAEEEAPLNVKDSLVMSVDEFNEKRKNLTNSDKTAIFSIFITRLPQNELQHLSLLLEDGITEKDLEYLEQMVHTYLKQDEVDRLLAILNKY